MRKGLFIGMAIVTVAALCGLAGYVSATEANASVAPTGGTSVSTAAAATTTVYDAGSMGIRVSGEGSVSAVPDVAVLSIGVEAEASTVDLAMDKAAEAMDKVMDALHDQGIADKDIKTRGFSIYPVWDWVDSGWSLLDDDYDERIIGYQVSNTASVKVRDIGSTGDVIDAAASAGGDLIRISGVSFTIDDPSVFEEEARAAAVADAKAKAQQLASLAGVHLGKAFYISESGGYYPTYLGGGMDYLGGDEAYRASTTISAGETEITVYVEMAFTIQ